MATSAHWHSKYFENWNRRLALIYNPLIVSRFDFSPIDDDYYFAWTPLMQAVLMNRPKIPDIFLLSLPFRIRYTCNIECGYYEGFEPQNFNVMVTAINLNLFHSSLLNTTFTSLIAVCSIWQVSYNYSW